MPRGGTLRLTVALASDLAEHVRNGNYYVTAAAACGVSIRSLYRWLAEGEQEDETLPPSERTVRWHLWHALKEAESEAERIAVGQVLRAGFEDWRAAMTYLERRFPDRWRRRSETTITVPGLDGGGPDPIVEMNRLLSTMREERRALGAAQAALPAPIETREVPVRKVRKAKSVDKAAPPAVVSAPVVDRRPRKGRP